MSAEASFRRPRLRTPGTQNLPSLRFAPCRHHFVFGPVFAARALPSEQSKEQTANAIPHLLEANR
jgi:hypothetical protein